MKPLILITSALSPSYGLFSAFDRCQQTKGTIQSIRKYAPEAHIFLVDVSVVPLDSDMKNEIISSVDYFMDVTGHEGMSYLSQSQAKSQSEALMTLLFLETIKSNEKFKQYDRIFKMTGRMELYEGFDTNRYDGLTGKYTFQTRVPTWMPTPYRGCTHLYNTRFYSFCSTLIDKHMEVLKEIFSYLGPVDLEHGMFACVPQELVVEFDKVYSKGMEASTGKWNYD